MSIRTAIIMAGGAGERFYPLSRMSRPKQLLRLSSGDKTMLQEAVDRILPIVSADCIFIATNELLLQSIRDNLPNIPPENIIAEPAKRNTAPCLAFAAAFVEARCRDLSLDFSKVSCAVLAADHFISPSEAFVSTVETALQCAELSDSLVTIGVRPTRPEIGYGYVKTNDEVKKGVFRVESFKEKPHYEAALQYLHDGNYYWNSGMFFWRLQLFKQELSKASPDVMKYYDEFLENLENNTRTAWPHTPPNCEKYLELPNISIDYALMEKANNVILTPAQFQWDDVGSWDAMLRTQQLDNEGNAAIGATMLLSSKNNVVYNGDAKKLVALYGVEDLLVAISDDVAVICPIKQCSNIKTIVEELRRREKTNIL